MDEKETLIGGPRLGIDAQTLSHTGQHGSICTFEWLLITTRLFNKHQISPSWGHVPLVALATHGMKWGSSKVQGV